MFNIPNLASRKWTAMSCAATFLFTTTGVAFASPPSPPFDYSQVRKSIEGLLEKDPSNGALFVRLAWHEAGTWDAKLKNGSPNDASMRFEPECKHGANAGLANARDALEPVKKAFPGLSYADLWALASIVAIENAGGPRIPFRWGRTDAKSGTECPPDGRLPDAHQGPAHVREVFSRMGMSDRETVALLGAHTLGHCHPDRSGYVGPWTHDPLGFDNDFFTQLLDNEWIVNTKVPKLQFLDSKTRSLMMLPADMALILDPEYKKLVLKYAKDQEAFYKDFASAYQKLLELGVADKLHSL
jgi:catalase (peroxidase I)